MIVVREEGTENAVDQAGCKDFVIARATFALEETAGEAAGSGEFFLVLHLQGHEIDVLTHFRCGNDGCKQHGIAHAHLNRAIGLLCQLTGLDGNLTTVRQRDGFLDWVHRCYKIVFLVKFAQRYEKNPVRANLINNVRTRRPQDRKKRKTGPGEDLD